LGLGKVAPTFAGRQRRDVPAQCLERKKAGTGKKGTALFGPRGKETELTLGPLEERKMTRPGKEALGKKK